MSLSIKPILLTACISYTLLVSQTAFAKEHQKRSHANPLQSLSLSAEQESKINDIGRSPMKHKRKGSPFKYFAPIAFTSELDEQQLVLAVEANIAVKKHQGLASAKRKHAVLAILTDEQKQQLEEKQLEKRSSRSEKSSLEQKLTKRLALTETQLDSIQTELAELDALHQVAREQRKTFKEFEKNLLNQETFDAEAWLTQFNTNATQMKTNATAFATNMHQIYLALDEQQQLKIKRGMQKKKPKNKKHS